MRSSIDNSAERMTLNQKLLHASWSLILLVCLIAGIGFVMLYSAANGSIDPWARAQMIRFGVGLGVLLVVGVVDIRFWMRQAYLLYLLGVLLLVVVEVHGMIGMGAQRWIDLGVIRIQPSELMKFFMVLALARYFHGATSEDMGRLTFLLPPVFLVLVPVGLVLKQPDLGTAAMICMASAVIFFLAGMRLWMVFSVLGAGLAALPVAWQFLRDYQKARVLTFLNPESDPLGSGYHIMQSKIALGSGGVFGKGLLQGTQTHLNFLPEKQTDFIFTMLAEETGLVGALVLLGLYVVMFVVGIAISVRCRHQFGRLLAMGITTTFFLYVFINMAMVMGLMPVVGVPLPLVSYGGTALITLMFGFGLLLSVHIHRDVRVGRHGASGDD